MAHPADAIACPVALNLVHQRLPHLIIPQDGAPEWIQQVSPLLMHKPASSISFCTTARGNVMCHSTCIMNIRYVCAEQALCPGSTAPIT
jgi:hypothetical protein